MRAFFSQAKKKIEAEIAAITGDDDDKPAQQPQQQHQPPPPEHYQQPPRAVFAHFMVRHPNPQPRDVAILST